MSPFALDVLLSPATVIFLCTVLVAFRVTKNLALSIFLGFVKAAVYTYYFAVVFDGTFTFLDDRTYLERGLELLNRDVGFTNLGENWELVIAMGGGNHFAYYLYNTYAFRLFGAGYYAPVALNVLVTLGVAQLGAKLAASEFRLGPRTSNAFFVFLLIHPDILAWSNVMNGKDILVLLLHVWLLFAVSIYLRGRLGKAVLVAAPAVLLLTFLRFYVPVLFAAAMVGSTLVAKRLRWSTVGYLFASGVLLAVAVLALGQGRIQTAIALASNTFVNPAFGFVRAAITPIPFNTDENFAFLNLPATIHWALIPFAIAGFVRIWKLGTPFSRFFVLYVLVFLGLYAVVGELQGPRQRVQLDYAWALVQFMGVLGFLRVIVPPRKPEKPAESGEVHVDWVPTQ